MYNRGGEASYGTQDAEIALAKKRGDTLVFIYVADVGFLNQSAAPLVVDVYQRLVKLGQFQLAMAQERAAAQNVVDQTVVRRGQLRTELVKVAQEIGATLIVLGRPIEPTAFFAETALQEFVADLQTETGIEARILDDE